jgi:hypothetical protein
MDENAYYFGKVNKQSMKTRAGYMIEAHYFSKITELGISP